MALPKYPDRNTDPTLNNHLPAPSRPFNDGIVMNDLVQKFDSAYTQRRKKSSPTYTWDLKYEALLDAQYQVLKAFVFARTSVEAFTWKHPITKTEYTCTFDMSSFSGENIGHNDNGAIWRASVKIKQEP